MMKKIYTLLLILFFASNIIAQQDPMYSLYMHDKVLINPAYAGSSNWVVGTLKYRTQFVGMEGQPVTETFNIHAPIQAKHIGIGLKIIHDKIALENNLIATGIFSYHLGFAGGKLSLGLEAGVINKSINFTPLIRKDLIDNSIPNDKQSLTVPDASIGMYYTKKNFYFGLSAYHLTRAKLNYSTVSDPPFARLYNHNFIYVGYIMKLAKDLDLDPSILFKSVSAAPKQVDIALNFTYLEKYAIGVQYRTGDALCALLKINITENIRVAYAYDYTLSKLASYSNGAHEIMLSYGIKLLPPPAEKEVHPRYYF